MQLRLAVLVALTLGTLGVATGGAAEKRLRIDVVPRFSNAPGSFRVRAIVAPEDKNRTLEVVADSPNYYRSSTIVLDGANAATVTEMFLLNMPKGAYHVTVTLTDAEGNRTSDSRQVGVGGAYSARRLSPGAPGAPQPHPANGGKMPPVWHTNPHRQKASRGGQWSGAPRPWWAAARRCSVAYRQQRKHLAGRGVRRLGRFAPTWPEAGKPRYRR